MSDKMTLTEEARKGALAEMLLMDSKLKSGQAIWDAEYSKFLCVHWETIRAALTAKDVQGER